jgi:drug/metabolite transporter (DMT)-like permease
MYFLALRFSLAALCLLLTFFNAFRSASWSAIGRGLGGGFTAGIFLWIGYVLQTFGLKYTTAGHSGFITGFYVALVPAISALLYRWWPQKRELAGIAIATLGMSLLTFPAEQSFRINRGDLLTLGCAVAFAFHLLLLSYYSQREMFQAVTLGQILCAAVLSALSTFFERPFAHWTGETILAILLTGIFATALAFAFQTWAQKHTTPTRTALIFAVEPVFALLTSILFAGEAVTAAAIWGGALILVGILVVEVRIGARTEVNSEQTLR